MGDQSTDVKIVLPRMRTEKCQGYGKKGQFIAKCHQEKKGSKPKGKVLKVKEIGDDE